MYGQTPSAYKFLVRAYKGVLQRMRLRESTMTIVLSSTLIAGGTAGTIVFSDSLRTTVGKDNDTSSPVLREIPEAAAESVSRTLPIAALESAATGPVSSEVRPTLVTHSVEETRKGDALVDEVRHLEIPAMQELKDPAADDPVKINLAPAQVSITSDQTSAIVQNPDAAGILGETKYIKSPEVIRPWRSLSEFPQVPAILWAPVPVVVQSKKKKSASSPVSADDSLKEGYPVSFFTGGVLAGSNPPGGGTMSTSIPAANPAGVFAPAYKSGVNNRLTTARTLLIYCHDQGTSDMYSAPSSALGSTTRYDYLQKIANDQRQWLAVTSGGKMDSTYQFIDAAIGKDPSTNAAWSSPFAVVDSILSAQGLNRSNYDYIQLVWDDMMSSTNASHLAGASGQGYIGDGTGTQVDWSVDYSRHHELGHNLGFSHAHDIDNTSTGASLYTYDFNTKQYVSTPSTNNSSSVQIQPLTVGLIQNDYGNPIDVMGGGGSGRQYNPRDKQAAGWMDRNQFKILTPGTNNQVSNITIHDPNELVAVTDGNVVPGQTGTTGRYGVQSGYANTPYAATFFRKGQKFVPNAGNTGGKWVTYTQEIDLNYVQLTSSTYGVELRLDNQYLGILQLNQSINEKDFAQYNYIQTASPWDPNHIYYDLVNDLHAGAPDNPNRYRSSWYTLAFTGNSSDTIGHYGNLQVTTHLGSTPVGYRWDASANSTSPDGSGTWNSASTNWVNLDSGNANTVWTDGKDATFGAASGTAGTVTVTGAVTAASLTFKPAASGAYTLTGGTITLGAGGLNAEASATIASTLGFSDRQVWEILGGNTVTLSGTVNANGNDFDALGSGTLALSGAGTYGNLSVYGNTVNQTASQTVSQLNLHVSSAWNVNGGTLTIDGTNSTGSNKDPGFDGRIVLNSAASSVAAPELMIKGGADLLSDLQINAGQHFVGMNGNSYLEGSLTGSGELAIVGSSDGNSFQLDNAANTFTGDFRVMRGILAVRDYGRLSGVNDLIFDVAAGQSGEFRTGANGTTLASLSTAGTNVGKNTVSNNSTFDATLTLNQSANTTYSGRIIDGSTGKLALNKTGTGTLNLTGGDSTYSGGTTVAEGMLRVSGSGALGTGAINLAGGTLSVNQRQGLSLKRISGGAMDTTTPGTGGVYTSDFSPLHAQNLVNGTFAYTGKIWLTSGHWSFGESFDDGAFLKINGTTLLNDTYYGNNTYSPYLNITADGWYDIDLRAYNSGGGGPYATGTWDNVKGVGIKKGDPTGNGTDYTAFNPYALGIKLRDLNTVANAVNLVADSTVEILDADAIQAETILTGIVSGSGALNKTGDGILTLANSGNTYTGAVSVSGGTLAAGATNAFSAVSAITLANASGVTLDLRGFNQTVASLAGGGTNGGNVTLGSATLTAGGNNTSTAFAGVISGTGGLTKAGTGTMSLSGQNTYTGATTVTGGVLNLDYSANALTSGLVNSASALVLDGGVLRVTGRSGATITQNFASLTLLDGANGINLVRNGATSLDVDIGAITRSGAGTIDFSGLTGSTAGARIKTSSGSNGALLDSGAQWSTYNGTDWASRDANGYIVAYTGYANIYNGTGSGSVVIPNTSGADVRIRQASSGYTNNTLAATTTAINSLLMAADTTTATVDIAGKTLSVAGISAGSGAKRLTLGTAANSGILTSSTNALQIISNNASASEGIVVNSVIADNGASPLAVSVSGGVNGGSTYFAGNNTYTGGTTVTNNAVLSISVNKALGTGAVTLTAGATLVLNGSGTFAVDNAIGGAGSLTKLGSNLVSLTGTNTYTGITTISDGTLRVIDGASIGTGSIVDNGNFTYACSNIVTLTNTISGTGSLTKSGAGTLILTGANSYGNTIINAGTLQIGDAGTAGSLGTGSVTGTAGTLAFKRSDSLTVANAIGGSVSFAQTGAGTITLTGANTYSGTTTIDAGTRLSVGAGGTAGTLGTGAVTNNGTLIFNRSDALTISAAIGGSGSVIHDGLGTTTLTGANTYSGTTTIDDGATLQVGDGNSTGTLGSGAVSLNGTLVFNRSDTLTISNTISGIGSIGQNGTGTTVITSDNALYFGTVTINSGALQFGDGGTTGSLTYAPLVNNASLIFKRSDTVEPIASISGTGSLTQSGTGTLILSKNNTYAGTTTIDAGGTLQVGNGGTAGTLGAGAVTDNGTLIFNRSNSFTVANVISGSGNLVKNGTGGTTLSGVNTYQGTTTVNAGSLQVANNATLGTGAVTLNSGGTLEFASGNDSFLTTNSANNYALNGGSLKYYSWYSTLNLSGDVSVNAAGGTLSGRGGSSLNLNGLVSGNGPLLLTGNNGNDGLAVTFNNATNSYSGTVTVGGAEAKAILGASTALRNATLNLSPGSTNTNRNQVGFVTGITSATIAGLSGSGTGGLQLKNNSNAAVALTVDQSADTTFAGIASGIGSLIKTGAGTLTLSGQNTYTGGTTVTGGVLALDFSASGSPSTNILAATGAVTLNGGTLRIIGKSGQNGTVQTFAGLTSGTAASTLELVQNGATSLDVNIGALNLGTGTLTFAGLTGTTAGARVITSTNAGANDGTTQLSATSALWNGGGWASVQQVSGVNYLVQWNGTYSDVYTNAAGGTTVIPNGGATTSVRILEAGANTTHNTLAAASTAINSLLMTANANGSTIDMAAGSKLTILGSGNVAMTSDARSLTIGNIAGQGTLTSGNSGAASLNLSNTNDASLLTVNANIADNGSPGGAVSLVTGGNVTLNGALTYTGSTTVGSGSTLTANTLLGGGNYAANILNNGTLTLNGAGVQTLSGVLGGSGILNNNSALAFNRTDAFTVANTISGGGSLANVGTGTLTLSRANTYTGGTTVSAGSIVLGNDSALGTGAITITATGNAVLSTAPLTGLVTLTNDIALNNTGTTGFLMAGGSGKGLNLSGDITGTTSKLRLDSSSSNGAAVFTLSGNNTFTTTNEIYVYSGSLRIGSATALGASTNTLHYDSYAGTLSFAGSYSIANNINFTYAAQNLDTEANTVTLSGVVGGDQNLTKIGSGTLVFSGANTYSGTTTISAGTLQIGNGGASGNLGTGAVTNNAALVFNRSGAIAVANVISGSGTLTNAGSGSLTLSGANTYTGATTLAAGTLNLTGSLGATAVSVASGATLTGTGTIGSAGSNGSLTLQTGSRLLASASGPALTLNGNLTVASGTRLDFDAALTSGQTYTALNYTGSFTGAASNFILGVRGTVATTATQVQVTASSSLALKWTGVNTSDWGINDGRNNFIRQIGSAVDNFYQRDTVLLDDTATRFAVDLANATTATDITFNNSTNNYSINGSGSMAVAGTLTKNGTGSTRFAVPVTLGNVAVNAGTLDIATPTTATISGAISGAGAMTFSGVGTTTLTGTNTYTGITTISSGTLQIGNGGTSGSLGTSAVVDNGALVFNRSDALTVDNAISGSGTLTKTGANTLTLNGANGYAGGTLLSTGALVLGNASALGTGTLTITATGNAVVSTTPLTGAAVTLANNIVLNNTGTTGFQMKGGSGNGLNLSGNISGTTSILRLDDNGSSGSAIFTLSGNNTFTTTNKIYVNSGSLRIGSATALGASTNTLHYDSYAGTLSFAGSYSIANNINFTFAAQKLDTGANSVTLSGAIGGNQNLNKIGSGILKLSGNNSGYSGATSVTAGTLVTANTSALGTGNVSVTGATLQIGDGVNNGVTLGSAATLALDANSTLKLGASGSKITMGSTGTFALTSGMNLDITGLNLGAGSYTVIAGTAAGSSVGTWSAGSDLLGGDLAHFAYTFAKVGNDAVFTVTAVPEPATYGLLGAASLAGVAMVRRRRRRRVVLP